MIISLLLIATY